MARTSARSRSTFRSRAAKSSRGRGAARARGGKGGGAGKYLLPAAAVAALGVLLWPSISQAFTRPPGTGPGPVGPVGPTPVTPTPRGAPWPAGTPTATVNPNAQGGMNVRQAPNPSSPLVSRNDAFSNQRVGVFSIGHAEQGGGCAACEWWQVMTPGGSLGYSRAVGPGGERNFTPEGPLPSTPREVPIVISSANEPPGVPMGNNPAATGHLFPSYVPLTQPYAALAYGQAPQPAAVGCGSCGGYPYGYGYGY
jgi:hypothetical protein